MTPLIKPRLLCSAANQPPHCNVTIKTRILAHVFLKHTNCIQEGKKKQKGPLSLFALLKFASGASVCFGSIVLALNDKLQPFLS